MPDMTLADFITQSLFLLFLLICVAERRTLLDLTDGNVERLERERLECEEAARVLARMSPYRVS